MSVKEEKVKVGEWNINYVKVGTGPHVVLCMPGALSTLWSAFKPQIEGLNRDKFTVVAWDPPGYGKSRPPLREFSTDVFEKEAAYAYEFMKPKDVYCWIKASAKDFHNDQSELPASNGFPRPSPGHRPTHQVGGCLRYVFRCAVATRELYCPNGHLFYELCVPPTATFALNIPKFSLLGWCSGGRSSMILSAKYPNAVNKLVIWGTNSYMLPEKLEFYKISKDINVWSQKMREPMIEAYGQDLFQKYWVEWVDGMLDLCDARDGDICTDVLKDIKCPTLILQGEKDPIVDPVQALHLHKHIEGSRLHAYPDGKHNVHLKYAEDFNKRVEEFLLS